MGVRRLESCCCLIGPKTTVNTKHCVSFYVRDDFYYLYYYCLSEETIKYIHEQKCTKKGWNIFKGEQDFFARLVLIFFACTALEFLFIFGKMLFLKILPPPPQLKFCNHIRSKNPPPHKTWSGFFLVRNIQNYHFFDVASSPLSKTHNIRGTLFC